MTTGNNTEIGTVVADDNGGFSTAVTIPDSLPIADQQQRMQAIGSESAIEAETPYTSTDWDRADVSLRGPGVPQQR